MERKCADTIGTVLAISNAKISYKYIFLIKYTEGIFSNFTRKLLWFEIAKILIAVKKKLFIVSLIIALIFGDGVMLQNVRLVDSV